MRTSPAGSERGFTLTELLVVLAIMALVVSVTPALYLNVIPGARIRSASVDLLAYLRTSRLEAARTGAPVVLAITPTAITAEGGKGFEVPSGTELSYKAAFEQGSADTITFYPEGGASGGTLTMAHGSVARSLAINWLTGHVEMAR